MCNPITPADAFSLSLNTCASFAEVKISLPYANCADTAAFCAFARFPVATADACTHWAYDCAFGHAPWNAAPAPAVLLPAVSELPPTTPSHLPSACAAGMPGSIWATAFFPASARRPIKPLEWSAWVPRCWIFSFSVTAASPSLAAPAAACRNCTAIGWMSVSSFGSVSSSGRIALPTSCMSGPASLAMNPKNCCQVCDRNSASMVPRNPSNAFPVAAATGWMSWSRPPAILMPVLKMPRTSGCSALVNAA